MYVQRKGWDVGEISVHVELKDVLGKNGFQPRIIKTVSFGKELDEKQKVRIMRIGEKCPISKLLTHPIEMSLKL